MKLTIRTRLTFWFTFAFAAALILVLGVMVLAVYSQIDNENTKALQTEKIWISKLFEHELSVSTQFETVNYDTLTLDLREGLNERYGLKRQFAIVTIEHNPEIIIYSGGVNKLAERFPAEYLDSPAGIYNIKIGEDHYLTKIFKNNGRVFIVGIENEMIFEVAEKTGQIMIWMVPLALFLVVAFGWFMARIALRPVVAAAQTADSISLANLNKRLPAYSGSDEFGILTNTLNQMISRLEDGVNRIQQFTQDAAHELRTPLTVLRGDMELTYQDEKTPKAMRMWLHKNLDRVIVLDHIVDNLMFLTRSDSGKYPIHRTKFHLDMLVKDIFEDMQIMVENRSINVQIQIKSAVDYFGDEILIRRLLLNLCDNALKYTSEGNIILSLIKNNMHIELVISDTGIGIPAEDLPNIFDRFYRVDKSHSRNTGGSGLGLAICKWIVTAHGGTIDISSEPGKGTSVKIILPLKQIYQ